MIKHGYRLFLVSIEPVGDGLMKWRYLNLPELSDAFDQFAAEKGYTLGHSFYTHMDWTFTGYLLAVVVRGLQITQLFIDSIKIRLDVLLLAQHILSHILAAPVVLLRDFIEVYLDIIIEIF